MASLSQYLFKSPSSYDPARDKQLADLQHMQEANDPWAARQDARMTALAGQDPEVAAAQEAEQAFELEKATAPARTQGQYAVKAAESKAQAQNDMLMQMLQGGMSPGQRVSVSGVGSTSMAQPPKPPQAPASVTNRLLQAQQAAQPSTFRKMFGMGPSQSAQNNLSGIVNEISSAEGIPSGLINDALNAAQQNPEASPEQLLQAVEGDDLTDAEREQFLSIFMRLR